MFTCFRSKAADAGSEVVENQPEPVKKAEESILEKANHFLFDDLPDVIAGATAIRAILPGGNDGSKENQEACEFIRYWNDGNPVSFKRYEGGYLPAERPLSKFEGYLKEYKRPPSDIQQGAKGLHLGTSVKIPSDNEGTLRLFPFRVHENVDGKLEIARNEITTQADRNLDESPNVINIVGSMDERGNLGLRSGVYNTALKANQVLAAVTIMHEVREKKLEIPVGKVRLLIQQLNTPGLFMTGEGRLIEGQAKQSHLIEQRIDDWLGYKEAPQVAYFNTSCNQFNALPNQTSHKKNLVGTAALVEWIAQDFFDDNPPEFLKKDQGLRKSLQDILTARDQEDADAAKELNETIKAELKIVAPELLQHSEHEADSDERRMQNVAARIVGHIAMQQTESVDKKDKDSTMTAISSHLLAGRLVNAMTMKNCWSGVDRTGFVSGLEYAIDRMLENELDNNGEDRAAAFETVFDFLLNFEQRVKEMDEATKGMDAAAYQAWLEVEGQEFKPEVQFQNLMWEYVMAVSEPLEWNSSGVWGLKWVSKGFVNPHPLPYLPRRVFDEESQQWISLIDPKSFDDFTSEGRQIFIGHAKHRTG